MHAGHPGGTGHTAQTEQRDAFDVFAQPHSVSQSRLQGGYGKTSDGGGENDIDFGGPDLCFVQRRPQGLLAQVESDVDEGVVGLGKTAELGIAFQRQCGVAGLNPAAEREPAKLRTGELGERPDRLGLVVAVRRELHGHPRHMRICLRGLRARWPLQVEAR